jgi:hypothetical protein
MYVLMLSDPSMQPAGQSFMFHVRVPDRTHATLRTTDDRFEYVV